MLQDESWTVSKQLGKGRTGSVMATINRHYPNVVLKRGPRQKMLAEATRLWQLKHPNVARVFGTLYSREHVRTDKQVGYMVLGRLGLSLQDMLDNQNGSNSLLSAVFPVVCLALLSSCCRFCWLVHLLEHTVLKSNCGPTDRFTVMVCNGTVTSAENLHAV